MPPKTSAPGSGAPTPRYARGTASTGGPSARRPTATTTARAANAAEPALSRARPPPLQQPQSTRRPAAPAPTAGARRNSASSPRAGIPTTTGRRASSTVSGASPASPARRASTGGTPTSPRLRVQAPPDAPAPRSPRSPRVAAHSSASDTVARSPRNASPLPSPRAGSPAASRRGSMQRDGPPPGLVPADTPLSSSGHDTTGSAGAPTAAAGAAIPSSPNAGTTAPGTPSSAPDLAATAVPASERDVEFEELQLRASSLRAQIAAAERELKLINDHTHAVNATERAERLHEKAAAIAADNRRMQKDITHLRNFDRVLVNLRDQLQTMQKHLRLRNANIRQKDATIGIIQRRITEQGEAQRLLLAELKDDATELAQAAEQHDGRAELADTVAPLVSMAPLVHETAEREGLLEGLLDEVAFKSAASESATAALVQQQRELVVDADAMVRSKLAELEDRTRAWSSAKAAMMRGYTRRVVAARDTAFHVRRGTNIKAWEQIPRAASFTSLTHVKDLTLTLHRDEQENALLQSEVAELRERRRRIDDAHAAHIAQQEELVAAAEQETAAALQRQRQLMRRLRELRGGTAGSEDDGGTAAAASRRGQCVELIAGAAENSQPPFAPHISQQVPPRFTPDTLRRLQTPTRAFRAHLDAEQEERRTRDAVITSVRRQRPHGVTV